MKNKQIMNGNVRKEPKTILIGIVWEFRRGGKSFEKKGRMGSFGRGGL